MKPTLFAVAAKAWLSEGAHWSESTRDIYELKLRHLLPVFGKKLVADVEPKDIAAFQRARKRDGASPAEINKECAVLRQILRKNKAWHLLAQDYAPLPEPEERGKALKSDEVHRLLTASRKSRSKSLYPALVLLLNTGMRVSELRTMQWRQVDLLEKHLVVGKSKTRGGEGRLIPLNREAYNALVEWRREFDNPLPSHYVFPTERYGLDGDDGMKSGTVAVWNRDPEKPIGSWKTAWGVCRDLAKVECRLHDLRHTFVSRLAEGQAPDQTIMALAGHMSRKMMERYSHVRNEAKRNAVAGLNFASAGEDSPQNRPQ